MSCRIKNKIEEVLYLAEIIDENGFVINKPKLTEVDFALKNLLRNQYSFDLGNTGVLLKTEQVPYITDPNKKVDEFTTFSFNVEKLNLSNDTFLAIEGALEAGNDIVNDIFGNVPDLPKKLNIKKEAPSIFYEGLYFDEIDNPIENVPSFPDLYYNLNSQEAEEILNTNLDNLEKSYTYQVAFAGIEFTPPSSPIHFPEGSKFNKQAQQSIQKNKAKYVREADAREVLKNLEDRMNPETPLGKLMKKVLSKLESKIDTKIMIMPNFLLKGITGNPGMLGGYHHGTKTIYVGTEELAEQSFDSFVKTFAHELGHNVMTSVLENPQGETEKELARKLSDLYTDYVILHAESSNRENNVYGFTNVSEFVSEYMSNPEFRDYLEQLDEARPKEKKSFLKRLIEMFRRFLGLRKTKETDKLLDEILDAARVPSEEIEGEYGIQEKRKIDEDNLDVDNTSVEKRLVNRISDIQLAIDLNVQQLSGIVKYRKRKKLPVENLDSQLSLLKGLQKKLEDNDLLSRLMVVAVFTENMKETLKTLEYGIDAVQEAQAEDIERLVKNYDYLLSLYSISDDILNMVVDLQASDQEILPKDALSRMREHIEGVVGKFEGVRKSLGLLQKKYLYNALNDIKFFKEVEKKHYDRLSKEFNELGLKGIKDKEQWIIDAMQRDKSQIDADVKVALEDLLENSAYDIYGIDVSMSSAVNVSSRLVQILNHILNEIETKRNNQRIKKDLEFEKLYKDMVKEKGTNSIKKLYPNILEQGPSGKWYFKGEYQAKFYEEVVLKIKELHMEASRKIAEIDAKMSATNNTTTEYFALSTQRISIINERKAAVDKIKSENIDVLEGGKEVPKAKWKNNLSNLTPVEKKALKFFQNLSEEIQLMTWATAGNANVKKYYDVTFIELPKITQNDTERLIVNMDAKGKLRDAWQDRFTRPDDYGYVQRMADPSGEIIRRRKIWYRDPGGNFNPKDQSLDIMTIMRLDYINGLTYQVRGEYEQELNFLLDIAKHKKFKVKEGTMPVVSYVSKKYQLVDGSQTNVYKMMTNMMESKFYDMLSTGKISLNGVDANKIVDFINSASAFLTLSLNLASGTANVLNANAQIFIESFLKGRYIKAAGVAKANKIYSATLMDSLRDITRPINRSYVNQIHEYFNTKGLFNMTHSNFMMADMMKQGLNSEVLRIFQESGEHYIQSITTLATLDGIKVMNSERKFIDKDGKVVSSDKAASLLDMISINKTDGTLEFSDKFEYTTHSKLTKWKEGGKENVDTLIHKKLYDIVGNYRQTDQPNIQRHWYGRLLMLYRKFLVPMGQSRLRNFENSFTQRQNLDENERRFSYALQEYDEGYYTTFTRFVLDNFKQKKFFLLGKGAVWNELSEYEKHNIKKFLIESAMVWVMLPLAVQTIASMQSNDDEEYIYFLLYQLRRLDTELSQYRSLSESFKMMRSPIPSMRFVENVLDIFGTVFNPFEWGETYEAGYNKGRNKLEVKAMKQLPVLKEFYRTYQDLFEYQDSYFGFK